MKFVHLSSNGADVVSSSNYRLLINYLGEAHRYIVNQ